MLTVSSGNPGWRLRYQNLRLTKGHPVNNAYIFVLIFCLTSEVLQADPKRDWEAPFDIVLPEPARNILLKAGVNAADWARNQLLSRLHSLMLQVAHIAGYALPEMRRIDR